MTKKIKKRDLKQLEAKGLAVVVNKKAPVKKPEEKIVGTISAIGTSFEKLLAATVESNKQILGESQKQTATIAEAIKPKKREWKLTPIRGKNGFIKEILIKEQ